MGRGLTKTLVSWSAKNEEGKSPNYKDMVWHEQFVCPIRQRNACLVADELSSADKREVTAEFRWESRALSIWFETKGVCQIAAG
jgi:hypothetical protein